uniref:FRAT regulator of WNT signaling pathway 2 n=1 Tax=Ursus americanus TaxID=9643 RepID=A0A452SV82_URSAM
EGGGGGGGGTSFLLLEQVGDRWAARRRWTAGRPRSARRCSWTRDADSPPPRCAPRGAWRPRDPRAVRATKARAPRAAACFCRRRRPRRWVPAPAGGRFLRCALGDRGRVRGRAAPYFVAELAAGPSALPGPCRRGWLRGAVASRRLQQRRWPPAGTRARDDDPHRLLQQLVLSGNLIKEAVRRLQRAVAAVAATSPAGASGPGGGRSGPDPVALQPSGALH